MINPLRWSRHQKSVALLGLAVVSVVTWTIAEPSRVRPKDPLIAQMDTFEKSVDLLWVEPQPKYELIVPSLERKIDKLLPFNSNELAAVVQEFKKFKAIFEATSRQRAELKEQDEWVKSQVDISERYLNQERRLYLNYFKNVHLKPGHEKQFVDGVYQDLDVILAVNVGDLISETDRLKFNVAHVQDADGGYSLARVSLTPQDLDQKEQQALQDQVTLLNYAKLVDFLAIRERITNHWALQRISTEVALQNPQLNSCGVNFISFKSHAKGSTSYYNALNQNDRFNDFVARVHSGLPAATEGLPLLDKVAYSRVLAKYYDILRSKFKPGVDDVSKMIYDDALKSNAEAYFGMTTAKEDLDNVEKIWKSHAEDSASSLLLSGYIADNWHQPSEIASRVAWVAMSERKALMAKQIVVDSRGGTNSQQAGKDNVYFFVDPKKPKDTQLLDQAAIEALNSELTPEAIRSWRAKIQAKVVQYLGSAASKAIYQKSRSVHFEEQFQKALPAIRYGARAKFVENRVVALLKHYESVCKTRAETFHPSPDCAYARELMQTPHTYGLTGIDFSNPAMGGFIPHRGLMDDTVVPWTPDQLSQFFYRKLGFWAEAKMFRELQKRAQEISGSIQVQRGMQNFFAALSSEYNQRLDGWKADPKLAKFKTEANQSVLLNESLAKVTADAYDQFLKYLNDKPPATERDHHTGAIADAVSTTVSRTSHEPESEYLPNPKDRERAEELFRDALAMLGLSPLIPFDSKSQLPESTRFQATTFMRLESTLNEGRNEERLVLRNGLSLLDQKIMAGVIYAQALTEQPILRVQLSNDADAPAVLALMVRHYKPQTGINTDIARGWYDRTVKAAARNIDPLVQEACTADPLNNGGEFHALGGITNPFNNGEPNWRRVFAASTGIRAMIQKLDSRYKAFDAEMAKNMRSFAEKSNAMLEAVNQWLFYASLIVLAAIATGGIGGLILDVAMTEGVAALFTRVGVQALATSAKASLKGGMLSMIKSIAGGIWKTMMGKMLIFLMNVQIAVMGYVGCYEMPHQLQYQLRVANSETESAAGKGSDRAKIHEYANLMHGQWWSVGIQSALQLVFVGRPLWVGAKNLLGAEVGGAVSRLAAVEGGAEVAAEMKVTPLTEMIKQEGSVWRGGGKWLRQTAGSLKNFGRITTLSANATRAQANRLMQLNLPKLLPTREMYRAMAEVYLENIDMTAARLKANLRNPSPKYLMWLRNKFSTLFITGEKLKMVIDYQAEHLVLDPGNAMDGGPYEFFVRLKLLELGESQQYWRQVLDKINAAEEAAGKALDRPEAIEKFAVGSSTQHALAPDFFAGMSEGDFMRHHEMFDWSISKTSQTLVQTWAKKNLAMLPWSKLYPGIRQFKTMFQDYEIINSELRKLAPDMAGAAADEAPGHQAAAQFIEQTSHASVQESEDILVVSVDPVTNEPIYVVEKAKDIKPSWWNVHFFSSRYLGFY